MKTIIQYIQEGYNTTSKLEEAMGENPRTIQRLLSDLVESGGVVREGSGPSTFYRVLKATPSTIEILEKMRLFHQQKSMSKDYRRFNREDKSDIILTWYIDTFPGRVDDYNEEKHNRNVLEAITQLEKEL
jgi:DNA-binding HxlR family transcriptional regulator